MEEKNLYPAEPQDETADSPQCALTFVLNLIGGKWKMPILWALSECGSLRYNALRRRVNGITNIMLTRCLTELADFGLVSREERQQIPPHVEYALTPLGRQLIPALAMLVDWGSIWKQYAAQRGLEPGRESEVRTSHADRCVIRTETDKAAEAESAG